MDTITTGLVASYTRVAITFAGVTCLRRILHITTCKAPAKNSESHTRYKQLGIELRQKIRKVMVTNKRFESNPDATNLKSRQRPEDYSKHKVVTKYSVITVSAWDEVHRSPKDSHHSIQEDTEYLVSGTSYNMGRENLIGCGSNTETSSPDQ